VGDGRQLWAAPEPDINVILRDGSELALPTGNELVPALDDKFFAVTAATAATAATAIPATPIATPSIFPIAATGTATATAVTTATAATTTIAGVILDIGFVHSDTVASSHATLLSSSTRHR